MLRQLPSMSNSRELQEIALQRAARRFALRFVAGRRGAGVRAIADLNKQGITATFDPLGENFRPSEPQRQQPTPIRFWAGYAPPGSLKCLLKPTDGARLDEELCFDNVARICSALRA